MRAVLLLAALAAPALACDPAEMEAAMNGICRGATEGAREAVHALPIAERPPLEAELTRLHELCAAGDPALAARGAARLAREAGRIEARHIRAATL